MAENRLAADLDHVLDHTRDLWDELRGGRIFITGGTGFFGCWLLESFAWANDRLGLNASALVLTRNLDSFRRKAPHLTVQPAICFHPGDVRTFEFPAGAFSHVIHAATESSARLNAEEPLTMFETIVDGTRRTLEFATRYDECKVLFTSSGAIYGKQPPHLTHIPEDYAGAPNPIDPNSAYGEGKRVAELLCTLSAKQNHIEAKIARCFAFIGPYLPLDIHFAIGNFIRDGLNRGPIIVRGDGTPIRSYLYAADLAIWLWTILFRGESCRAYNVGSEEALSIAEVAHFVAGQFPETIPVEVRGTPSLDRPFERYVPSTTRANRELALYRSVELKDAIYRTVKFFKES